MDGPRGSVGMRACRWACRRVGVWMRMAVSKKGKRKKEKNTDWWVPDVWMGVWTCGCVGVWVCRWACSHVGMRMRMAVNKKEKKNTYWGVSSMWMGMRKWITVKKRKEKRKTHWSGHVDVLRMGVRALVGRRGWL